jgi:hypothetical protein
MSRKLAGYVLATLVLASSGSAQEPMTTPESHWQFIVSSGTVVPTGAQRDAIARGKVTAAQLSYLVQQGFAVTASVGWARTRDLTDADRPRVDMFTYDVGAELRAGRRLDAGMLNFSPFIGIGAGGRSYNYRSLDIDATHNLAGYAAAGGELGVGSRVTLRLEARDNVTGFSPLAGGGEIRTRNDVTVMGGLRVRVR